MKLKADELSFVLQSLVLNKDTEDSFEIRTMSWIRPKKLSLGSVFHEPTIIHGDARPLGFSFALVLKPSPRILKINSLASPFGLPERDMKGSMSFETRLCNRLLNVCW